jgi:hypothetical protein
MMQTYLERIATLKKEMKAFTDAGVLPSSAKVRQTAPSARDL